jgi:hypothetical protein
MRNALTDWPGSDRFAARLTADAIISAELTNSQTIATGDLMFGCFGGTDLAFRFAA